MIILGLNWTTPYWTAHETGASLIKDGEIIAAMNEDRITGFKHDSPMPLKSLAEVLRIGKEKGISPEEINFVAIPKKSPVDDYFFGLTEIIRVPTEYKNIARIIPLIRDEHRLKGTLAGFGITNAQIRYVEHHLAHAAAGYYSSGFDEALVITSDGIGHQKTATVSEGRGKDLNEIACSKGFENSLGFFYSMATNAIGFHPNDGEGKTTGLACYGSLEGIEEAREMAKVEGLEIKGNYGLPETKNIEIEKISKKGFEHYKHSGYTEKSNKKMIEFEKKYGKRNLAACAQKVLEERCVELAENAFKKTGIPKICLSGGTFLNVKVNKLIREIKEVEDVFIFPNPGDAGLDVGAAMHVYNTEESNPARKKLEHVYLGTEYSNEEIEKTIEDIGLGYEKLNNAPKAAGDLVAEGKVIGWFQGALEYGPRALGNRSVVADPRNPKMRDKINNYLKKRDWFMPFAPSMLDSAKEEYLINPTESPFMIMAFDVPKNKAKDFAAAVHVDNTTRPHTVKKEVNEKYFNLIKQFEKNTGIPIVLNTSFNKHGHVIVRTPLEALNHLSWGCIEELIIGDYRVYRKFTKPKGIEKMKI